MRILILFLIIINSLFAHKLNIFLSEENNRILVNSYFASGAPCKNCKVEVYNLKNELVSSSKTNENGDYWMNQPKDSIIIKVEAIGGHAVKTTYKLDTDITNTELNKNSTGDSLLQSLIAIILIFIIFVVLKRVKK